MTIITISGLPGAGKTTTGKLLAKQLNYEFLSIGTYRRQKAKKIGMTIHEYNEYGKTNPETDIQADNYQKELGKNKENFIFEGRLSFHFIPNSIKIFFNISPEEAAKRILKSKRKSEGKISTIQEQIEQNKKRIQNDKERYQKYYKINPYDLSHYDIIIDTSNLSVTEQFEILLKIIKKIINSQKN